MERKLRFFKDQVSKAGLISSALPDLRTEIELEELEVHFYIIVLCYSQLKFIILIIIWGLQFCGSSQKKEKKKNLRFFWKKGKEILLDGRMTLLRIQ